MADEREEEGIKIVDSRRLNEDERAGNAGEASEESPRLQMVEGGQNDALETVDENADSSTSDAPMGFVGGFDGAEGDEQEREMTPEEQEELRNAMEQEQFTQIEGQIGRPLTDEEKDQVREQMEAQAQAAMNLEVAPMLLEVMVRLPQYAAVHLGLTANPYTQLIARNDANAKMAIDAFGSMFDAVKSQLDTQSRREFERVLNDLRVNYTRITGQPIGPSSGPSLITGPRIIR